MMFQNTPLRKNKGNEKQANDAHYFSPGASHLLPAAKRGQSLKENPVKILKEFGK
jgi:hypothetical protein